MDYTNFDISLLGELELAELIGYHNRRYWEEGDPLIDDIRYDELVRALEALNPDHEILQAVHAPMVAGLGSVRHVKPLLSLDKAYSLDKVLEWAGKIARSGEEIFLVEPKYDGISVVYYYDDKILATRGEKGIEGENISDKLPLMELEAPGYTGPVDRQARGEIVMRLDRFIRFRDNIFSKGNKRYKNSRNVLTGLMTLKESKDIAQVEFAMNRHHAKLTLVDYDLISRPVELSQLKTEWEGLLEEFETLPYPLDGVVIKLADRDYSESLGNTAHHPRGEIAFKFENARKESQLQGVRWSFGKNCLTPVAEIEPVLLGGITIRHATLHNLQNILDRDIQVGDTVTVERAGDVIPYIASSLAGDRRMAAVIGNCPACGSDLIQQGPELCCPNYDCPETNLQRLCAAVKNIGIENLGEPTIRQMMELLNVRTLSDIFQLDRNALYKLDNFQTLKVNHLYQEIQSKRTVHDYQLLAALNIPHVGINIAKLLLADHTLSELETMNEEDLSAIKGIGPERAREIHDHFRRQVQFLNELKSALSIIPSQHREEVQTICFTGKMPEKRAYYETLARQNGFAPTDDVKSDLTLLVAADIGEKSTKIQKARRQNVQILSLSDWLSSLQIAPEAPRTGESSDEPEQLSLF